jgi:hypothetical protein
MWDVYCSGSFSDVGHLVMECFDSGMFRAVGPLLSVMFHDETF